MTMWGGCFSAPTDKAMRRFNDSIAFDQRLFAVDVRGSIAWASALQRAGLLTTPEHDAIVAGLEKVAQEFAAGTFATAAGDEDIHTAVERRLGELAGEVAGKLHTGRSRNDQVATDMRLYMLETTASLETALLSVQSAVIDRAGQHLDVLMPGYTHMQPAQPVLFAHWLLSYFWKLQRDRERLVDVRRRTSVCPLGAGALAGTPFAIDRAALARELGFAVVSPNSIDAVADRDYLVEFLSWAALLQTHLSALAEDLVIWSTREFGFVQLDERYSTGSSLMPQKRNPDSMELLRGKSGRMAGHLMALLTVLKGLPSGYNKDLQEDKEGTFDAIDTLLVELAVAEGVVRTLRVNAAAMEGALDDAMLSTDIADYLVLKGIPFRTAHGLVGQVVKRAEALGVTLRALPIAEYRAVHAAFGEDVYQVIDPRRSVSARTAEGGTAPSAVRAQIEVARSCMGLTS